MKKYLYILLSTIVFSMFYFKGEDKKATPPTLFSDSSIKDSLIKEKAKRNAFRLTIAAENEIEKLKNQPIYLKIDSEEKNYFLQLYKNELVINESKKSKNTNQIFALIDNLAFPKRKPNCVTIIPIKNPLVFFYQNKTNLSIKKYTKKDIFLKKSSFCLFMSDKKEWIIQNMDSKKFLFYKKNDTVFSKKRLEFKSRDKAVIFSFIKASSDKITHFKTFNPQKGYHLYKFKNKNEGFIKQPHKIDDHLFFQPITINKLYEGEHAFAENSKFSKTLRIRVKSSALSFKKHKSYLAKFMLTPALSPIKNRDCFSIASFTRPTHYIIEENFQLFLKKFNKSIDFKKKATLCPEVHDTNVFRLASSTHQNHYVDYHTMDNGHLYFMQDNMGNPQTQFLSFETSEKHAGTRYFSVFNPKLNKKSLFYYNKKKKSFIQEPELKKTKKINFQLKSFFDLENFKNPKCEYYNDRQKMFYQNLKIKNNYEISFIIDTNDHLHLNKLDCNFPISKTKRLILKCNTPNFLIDVKQDCIIITETKKTTTVYSKAKMDSFSLKKIED